MLHVFMLNLSYDVPVKLFSGHLLAMAAVLLWLDRQRLAALFLLNKPAEPRPIAPWFASRTAHLAMQTLLMLFVGWVAFFNVVATLANYHLLTVVPEQQPIYGIYEATSFVKDGEEQPPLLTDSERWRGVIFEQTLPMQLGDLELPGMVAVWHMDGRLSYHVIELNAEACTISFPPAPSMTDAPGEDLPPIPAIDVLTYEQPTSDELILRGRWQGHDVEIRFVRRSLEEMELLGRGFHWINETPHNV
jgi:hypothetical protein